jgi:phage terminase small subunit
MTHLKPRHERFCRNFVASRNATDAARIAGYSLASADKQGYRLIRRADIRRRLTELEAEIAQRDCLSLDAQLVKLEAACQQALRHGRESVVVRIVEMQAKLAGLIAKRDTQAEAAATDARNAATNAAIESTRAALSDVARQVGVDVPRFEASA